jgi:hypothetical protein
VERDRSGIVWIAPEVGWGWDLPTDRLFDPEHSLFWARWELWNEDSSRLDHDGDEIILGAEAAIQWGHERADVILIRLSGGDSFYSAGRAVRTKAFGMALQPWPPDRPAEGWFRPPEDFIRETLREWREAKERPAE